MNTEFRIIAHGSEEYRKTVALRDAVLRKPLGLVYTEEQLAAENNDHHLTLWDTDSDKPMACLIMTPVNKEIVKMRQFAVDPSLQRQGAGGKLLKYTEEWAAGNGFRTIEMHARETAIPFYEKHGYTAEGPVFEEVTIPHRKMKKALPGT